MHADSHVQSTTGGRAKTTRRKSTRTVRGAEGAYCAMVAEEMASAPPETRHAVHTTTTTEWMTLVLLSGLFATKEAAEEYIAGQVGRDRKYPSPGVTHTYLVTEVSTVVVVERGGHIRRVIK